MYSALPKMLQPVASESDFMRTWIHGKYLKSQAEQKNNQIYQWRIANHAHKSF